MCTGMEVFKCYFIYLSCSSCFNYEELPSEEIAMAISVFQISLRLMQNVKLLISQDVRIAHAQQWVGG